MTAWLRKWASPLILLAVIAGSNGGAYALAIHSAAVTAALARAHLAVRLCQAVDRTRTDQIGLWEYVIRISRPPRTVAERARLASFERYLHVVFAPVSCTQLARTEPAP